MITWNPNDKGNDIVLTNENLTVEIPVFEQAVRITKKPYNKKSFLEIKVDELVAMNSLYIGITSKESNINSNLWNNIDSYTFVPDGRVANNNKVVSTISKYYKGDTVLLVIDQDKLSFYTNSVLLGSINHDLKNEYYVFVGRGASVSVAPRITANFGNKEFDTEKNYKVFFSQLINEGYLPYDYNSYDRRVNPSRNLVKSNGKYLDVTNDSLRELNLQEPIVEEDFINSNLFNLRQLTELKDTKTYNMEHTYDLEEFKVYKTIINKDKYPVVKKITTKI